MSAPIKKQTTTTTATTTTKTNNNRQTKNTSTKQKQKQKAQIGLAGGDSLYLSVRAGVYRRTFQTVLRGQIRQPLVCSVRVALLSGVYRVMALAFSKHWKKCFPLCMHLLHTYGRMSVFSGAGCFKTSVGKPSISRMPDCSGCFRAL